MMNRIKKSFSLKVVLWVVVIAITIFLLSLGVLFRQSRKLVRTESVEQTNVALNAAMQRISRYLVTAKRPPTPMPGSLNSRWRPTSCRN
jgi:hypothetical protein